VARLHRIELHPSLCLCGSNRNQFNHVALISNGTTIRVFDIAGAGTPYADRKGVGDT
jgi:hypothetical protein